MSLQEFGYQEQLRHQMDLAAKILGGCWIGIGVLYYLVLALRAKKPASLEIAPSREE